MKNCPFCERIAAGDTIVEGNLAVAIWDGFPVSTGHLLLVPKRHVPNFFDLTDTEKAELFHLLAETQQRLTALHHPAGFNIGINVGEAAGQTVQHAHIHLIPRYHGDVPDPRGGVRHVIPGRGYYPVPRKE